MNSLPSKFVWLQVILLDFRYSLHKSVKEIRQVFLESLGPHSKVHHDVQWLAVCNSTDRCTFSSQLINDIFFLQEDVLSVLAKHLDESALQTRSFLVDVSGTSIDKEHICDQVNLIVTQNKFSYKPRISSKLRTWFWKI